MLEKLTQDLIFYEKQRLKLQHDNDDILEICNNLSAATVTRPHNPGAQTDISFKRQIDLKLTYLIDNVEVENDNVKIEKTSQSDDTNRSTSTLFSPASLVGWCGIIRFVRLGHKI